MRLKKEILEKLKDDDIFISVWQNIKDFDPEIKIKMVTFQKWVKSNDESLTLYKVLKSISVVLGEEIESLIE